MIISLEDAQKIYPAITQDDLNGLEISIRKLTNNPFQNRRARYEKIRFDTEDSFSVLADIEGIRKGDTVQISSSKWNNGLYVVEEVDGGTVTVQNGKLFPGYNPRAFVTKVEYPADVLAGVRKLLAYDAKMQGKIGLKSKTVSRMSETYFDQNSGETVNGYPAAMMSFLNKYRLLGW